MKIQKKQEIEFFGTKTGNANSIALGYATETKNFGEVAVGVMNKSTAAKDPNSSKGVCVDPDATLFSVGCGGSGERKNALEVKGDGSVIIPGENGNINIADKIKQAFDADASIELVKSAENSLQYTLMVNNEPRGSINIPKDQFLKNVTYDSEGKQLVFTFVTLDEDEHVERVPVGDLKDIYTAGNGINIDNNVISADFSSVMTAISDEKTQRETTDNEIKSTLDTKADKTDVNNRLDNLQNRCFELGDNGQIAAPYRARIFDFNKKIQKLNNDEEYTYADITAQLTTTESSLYIYDKTLDVAIKITKVEYFEIDPPGDFFRTAEPLDLTHTFYLDNEKAGIVENLTRLAIEESGIFANLQYIDISNGLNDDKAPQYIYDANDNKWIEIVETHYIDGYKAFNTEKPLDLTHELYYSYYNSVTYPISVLGDYSIGIGHNSDVAGKYSTALGTETFTNSDYTVAIGYKSGIKTTNCYGSVAIGIDANVNTGINTLENYRAIAIGNKVLATGNSIVLGSENKMALESICIGNTVAGICNNSIVIGNNTIGNVNSVSIGNSSQTKFKQSLSLGYSAIAGGNYAIAIGKNVSNTKSIFGVGFNGVNGIDMDRDNYGLYLKGFGGYDGTNLVVTNGGTETLNPDIKSVQQIINEKADSSSIPTKTSQLTNDSGYLTAHQSLDGYAKLTDIPNVNTKADLINGKLKADQLPKLNNITAATTTEDMITKFNDLLADLKAKGYMTADVTA